MYLEVWFGDRKKIASLNTIASHISNLFIGVTIGFQYRMRSVYAHFPINIEIKDKGRLIEIKNFLGEKKIRKIKIPFQTKCEKNEKLKDEIIIKGADLKLVSLATSSIQQLCLVKNKDIRKFLDGIYVSEKKNYRVASLNCTSKIYIWLKILKWKKCFLFPP